MALDGIPENKNITYLGLSSYRDENKVFGIKRKDRRQHIYILGKSGTGKSALMYNMILQNIENGDGVCMVDPHGENVEAVLASIPPHRMKDVIYFNPADTEHHIGFNVLELVDPKYKHLVASGLMGIFTKIWANAWSARMEYILNNTILALLDTPGSTLLGITRMLVDKDYRQKIIENLKDPVIKAFWVHEYEAWQDKFRNEAIAPIQNKVGQFLSTSIIRNIVGQAKSTINVFDIMNQGKIFLVNVSKGRIGEDNSALLGGMIITKIQLAAMERVRIPEEERKDFYLYVDEFQNFVTQAFAGILSEARKYRLNLTVAHQYTAQLIGNNKDTSVRDAIFGNVGTMVVFRVGAEDAKFLEKEFEPEFTPQDIVSLPNFKVYLKLMIDGVSSRPFSARTMPPLLKPKDKSVALQVEELSRSLYARPREVVEREISDWSGMHTGNGNDANTQRFSGECISCGKTTFVFFKPEANRPIYCKECLIKIKSEGGRALDFSERTRKRDEKKFFKPLADVGIEFTQDGTIPKKGLVLNGNRDVHNGKNPKPSFLSKIKSVLGSAGQKKPAHTEESVSALREVLARSGSLDKKEPEVKVDTSGEEKLADVSPKKTQEFLSLDALKDDKITRPNMVDKSAKPEEMDLLKNFILEKNQSSEKSVVEKDDTRLAGKDLPEVRQDTFSENMESTEDDEEEEDVKDDSVRNLDKNVSKFSSLDYPDNLSVPEKNEIGDKNISTKTKEVPEDVLKKILEE